MHHAPEFWWLKQPNWQARLLAPFGALYGAITAQRMAGHGHFVGVPVMCVGNFIAGGAGKTPVAIALAQVMKQHNLKPFFLTRGYGATPQTTPHRVGDDDDYKNVGDEALVLARTAPVIVCTDRIKGAYAAAEQGADVIIMDDGLQNPSLKKTRSLAVVDGMSGVGNGLCLPAGPLRAPLEAQWPYVSGLVVIGEGEAGHELTRQAIAHDIPVIKAHLTPSIGTLNYIRQRPVMAFAGIGRPSKFFTMLRAYGVEVMEHLAFPDHHPFSASDIDLLMKRARQNGVTLIVTTEKDLVRIPQDLRSHESVTIIALPVEIHFDDMSQIERFFHLMSK